MTARKRPRLLRHPPPYPDELLTSWLMRLARANGERLTWLANHLFGTRAVWIHDPDRLFNDTFRQLLTDATGVPGGTIDQLLLSRFEGRLSERLVGSASPWLLVLARQGYHATRHTHLYCPACLADDAEPHLSVLWRLAFMSSCSTHGTLLRDACPHCGAVYAPTLNDLGPGRDWRRRGRLPFAWCHACGRDLRVGTEAAPDGEQAFQARLVAALRSGSMAWDGLGEVPALEGFEVLRQLLNVLFLAGSQKVVSAHLPGPERFPEDAYPMFREFSLQDRRVLLGQLAYLVGDWPARLLDVARQSGLTRRPLVAHLPKIPAWYDLVADQLHQGNGRRRIQRPLVPHLDLAGIGRWRDAAKSAEERRRWEILWQYAQQPNKQAVADHLGARWALVSKVVDAYNAGGPQALRDPRIGRVDRQRRVFTEEQEAALVSLLAEGPMTTKAVGEWSEAQTGRRLDPKTVRRYCRAALQDGS